MRDVLVFQTYLATNLLPRLLRRHRLLHHYYENNQVLIHLYHLDFQNRMRQSFLVELVELLFLYCLHRNPNPLYPHP